MRIIGLTGGIGTGKSTAASYLQSKGYAVIDADQIGRDMTADGSPMIDRINTLFGPSGPYGRPGYEILSAPGKLDRKAMADLVFGDEDTRNIYNEIMFGAIISAIQDSICDYDLEGREGVLIDAPLLFESGANELCDKVILITADLEKRIERVALRDGMSREDIVSRINSQMSDEEKAKLADFVVDNSGSVGELEKNLDQILNCFK